MYKIVSIVHITSLIKQRFIWATGSVYTHFGSLQVVILDNIYLHSEVWKTTAKCIH